MPISDRTMRDRVIPRMIEYLDTEYEKAEKTAYWKKLFSVKSTDEAYHESRTKESAGPLQFTPKRGEIPEVTLGDGYPKRIAQMKFTGMVTYAKEDRMFDRANLIADNTRALGRASNKLKEILIHAFMEYGDTALASVPQSMGQVLVDTICGDQLTAFNTAHTFKSNTAQTYANLASYTSLIQSTVQDAFNAIMLWPDSSGFTMGIQPKQFVVPVGQRQRAFELFASPLRSQDATNALNALREDLTETDILVDPFLVNQVEWYIKTDAPNNYNLYQSLAPEKDDGYEKKTQEFFVTMTEMFGLGANDPRHIYAVKQ